MPPSTRLALSSDIRARSDPTASGLFVFDIAVAGLTTSRPTSIGFVIEATTGRGGVTSGPLADGFPGVAATTGGLRVSSAPSYSFLREKLARTEKACDAFENARSIRAMVSGGIVRATEYGGNSKLRSCWKDDFTFSCPSSLSTPRT